VKIFNFSLSKNEANKKIINYTRGTLNGSEWKELFRSLFHESEGDKVHFNKWFRIYTFCVWSDDVFSLSPFLGNGACNYFAPYLHSEIDEFESIELGSLL
jgi:hypothetical protein